MSLSRKGMREYQRKRRASLGVKPRWCGDNPQKPPASLRSTNLALYMRLYMRWWRRFALCDEADQWQQ